MDGDRSIELADGRQVSYLEVGPASGRPVILLHGTPSSRMEASGPLGAVAAELGLRLLAPDRPGYGGSTFTRYTVRDHPRDVAGLLDAVGVGEFGVVGVSGGGRYACACAASLGSRVSRMALVASTAPADLQGVRSTWRRQDRQLYLLAVYAPWLLRTLLAVMARRIRADPRRVPELFGELPSVDHAVLQRAEVREVLAATMMEAFRQGTRGAVHDLGLEARPWGIDLSTIGTEVEIWHGGKDAMVPVTQGEVLAREIPSATLRAQPDDGHVSLRVDHIASILEPFA